MMDIIGDRYGRLLVLQEVGSSGKNRRFECRCDCGSVIVTQFGHLRGGASQSCGCLHRELASEANWRGGKSRKPSGYVTAAKRGHARKAVYEHIAVVTAFGIPLPDGAVVHHVNEDKSDNRPSNLVVCQNHGYHMFLHARMRVVKAGGNPNTERFCTRCTTVKPLDEFRVKRSNCRECDRQVSEIARGAAKKMDEAVK